MTQNSRSKSTKLNETVRESLLKLQSALCETWTLPETFFINTYQLLAFFGLRGFNVNYLGIY